MATARLIVGGEEFLVARAVSAAVAESRARADDPDLVDVVDLPAAECEADQLAELTSPSLFGDERIVVLRSMQDAGKQLVEGVAELVEAGRGEALVMTHAGGVKGKSVIDSLRQAGATVDTIEPPRTGRDREQWVVDEARRHGGSLDRGAATELINVIGTDLRELATVIAQLVTDAGPKVGVEEVATYHRGRAELTGFAVADRAVEGSVGAALEAVRWALSSGVDPVLISSALAGNLRLIGQVAGAPRGGSAERLAGTLRQPPWKVRRAQGWLRSWTPEALSVAVRAVADADADVKGGGDDAAYAVERAVLAVATAAAA